jgi:hypothetical protein
VKVADIQQTLRSLGHLLEAAGAARSKVDEVVGFADGLEAFRDQSVGGFLAQLGRLADGGETVRTPARGGRSPARLVTPAVDPADVRDETRRLYDQAPNGINESDLIALRGRLGGLKKDDLKSVAAVLGFRPTGKENTNPKLVDAICTLIEKRAGASIRRNLINRTEQPNISAAP